MKFSVHMDFKFKILTEENLLIQKRSGTATIKDILASIKECQNNPDYHPGLDMLSDFRKVDFDIDLRNFNNFTDKYIASNYLKSKIAIITSNPKNTAITSLFEYTKKQQSVKLFSTIRAACNWLNVDYGKVSWFFDK